jgi:hypothetical protein
MLRPDHIWFFFTVMLSLALTMSIPPRKSEQQNQANLYTQMREHRSCGETSDMITDWQELFYVDAALVGVELENSPKVLLDYFGPRLNNNFHRAHPITGIPTCPRAASGHAAAAPPSSVMNSRRFIRDMDPLPRVSRAFSVPWREWPSP